MIKALSMDITKLTTTPEKLLKIQNEFNKLKNNMFARYREETQDNGIRIEQIIGHDGHHKIVIDLYFTKTNDCFGYTKTKYW